MGDIDLLILNTVNAPMRRSVSVDALLRCLDGTCDSGEWQGHVRAFFEDVPREALFRFMIEHHLPAAVLRDRYRTVFSVEERAHGDLDAWLGELADAA